MSLNIVNSFKSFALPIGGWIEVGRTTLGSPSDTITVSGIANKRYYMFLIDGIAQNNISYHYRMGNTTIDTGPNYASRGSVDGGADGTAGNATEINARGIDGPGNGFDVGYIANLSDKEKLLIGHNLQGGTLGAGTAPDRGESVGKWAETSNPLDHFGIIQIDTGDMGTGAEIVVLGWDPADTHTDNFWEELASVDLSGGTADVIDSGTFTSKKYLWIQLYIQTTAAGDASQRLTFNADAGPNYSVRTSNDGNADLTATNTSNIDRINDDMVASSGGFTNLFMINNLANEKLGIAHAISAEAAGAGTAPTRDETVIKWANTSSQITQCTFTNTRAGEFGTNTILKVWGSD